MHDAAIGENFAVIVEKPSGSEALIHLFHLRVGKRNPNFRHFARSKHPVDDFDACAQKRHIFHAFGFHDFGTRPHACTLDIDADVVFLWETLTQSHGIFAFATAQFQHNGCLIVEIIAIPLASHRAHVGANGGKRILEHASKRLHIGELF